MALSLIQKERSPTMRSLKGIVAVFLGILFLCYAVKIHTSASTQAPHWENAPDNSGDFVYWDGTETVCSDTVTQEKIMWMQNALNWCVEHEGLNAETISVDGSFGPASQRATDAFQAAAGLPHDGSFGPMTVQAMKQIIYDGQPNSLTSGIGTQPTAQTQTGLQVSYGNSTKALPDSCCNCAPDEKCSDCGTVYFFSAVNNLKTAIRKSPLIERIRDSLVLALENLFQ